MNVVVIGAGIIGASISRHLAANGAKVTVLEAAPVPAQGATGKSWAWLNANAKKPLHYRDLNLRSMQLWQQDHSSLCTFCGCLMLHDERSASHDTAYPSQHIPAGQQLQGSEPGLNPELTQACQHARLYPLEGWCDPLEATQQFLAEAEGAGAQVFFGHKVQSISCSGGRATAVTCSTLASASSHNSADPLQLPQQHQQQQQFAADAVVLAAGVGCSELAAQLGYELPLLHKPAAIVMTQPLQPGIIQHMVVTDSVFILQRHDGCFLIGETQPSPASSTDTSSSNATRILQQAARAVPALNSATIQGMYVGYRPYPADGYPVVGWLSSCSNAYVAVTHSGMTLAPLIGKLATDEIMAALQSERCCSSSRSQEAAELLAPYRPGRDFAAAAAAAASKPGLSWAATLRPTS